jgi:hypothetical protein
MPAVVLQLRGHTEAAVDLARLAGGPGGAICEVLDETLDPARRHQRSPRFARRGRRGQFLLGDRRGATSLLDWRRRRSEPDRGEDMDQADHGKIVGAAEALGMVDLAEQLLQQDDPLHWLQLASASSATEARDGARRGIGGRIRSG